MLARRWRKGNTLLVGMQTGAGTLENSIEVPQKIKNRYTKQSSNFTARYLPPTKMKTLIQNHLEHFIVYNVYCSMIYNNQDREATQMSTYGGMDKEDTVYNGILFSQKKKKNKISLPVTKRMALADILLGEISQRDKSYMISLICEI